MKQENQRGEGLGIIQEIAVVIDSGIVDKHLYRQSLRGAQVIEFPGGLNPSEVHHYGPYLAVGKLSTQFCGLFLHAGLVADSNNVIAVPRKDTGILEAYSGTGSRHQSVLRPVFSFHLLSDMRQSRPVSCV